ncbi:type II secretion system protein [bacterium]|nr:type II secretion system protein [bacterium]
MRAYTLGEVVVALALMLVVTVFVIGLFLKLFQSSTKNLDSSIALEMAESVLSQAKDADPASWPTLVGTQNVYNRDAQATTEFVTKLASTQLDSNPMGEMYELAVEVYWMDQANNASNRRDYGRQSVLVSRFVYVSNMKP